MRATSGDEPSINHSEELAIRARSWNHHYDGIEPSALFSRKEVSLIYHHHWVVVARNRTLRPAIKSNVTSVNNSTSELHNHIERRTNAKSERIRTAMFPDKGNFQPMKYLLTNTIVRERVKNFEIST